MLFGAISTSQSGATSTALHADQHPTAMPNNIIGLHLLLGPQEGMPGLTSIHRAQTAEATLARLDEFEAGWCARYPNKSSPAASGDGSAAGLSTV